MFRFPSCLLLDGCLTVHNRYPARFGCKRDPLLRHRTARPTDASAGCGVRCCRGSARRTDAYACIHSGRTATPGEDASQPGRATLNYPSPGPLKPVAAARRPDVAARAGRRLTFARIGVVSPQARAAWPSPVQDNAWNWRPAMVARAQLIVEVGQNGNGETVIVCEGELDISTVP